MVKQCTQRRSEHRVKGYTGLVCAAIALAAILPPASFAQAPAKNTAGTTVIRQWEYLAVSFGKTIFSDPIADPEIKTAGGSKLLAFSRAGIVTAEEAVDVQRQMDALGRFGWELVGTVGTIGGDQELLFKRPFDAAQSNHEAALIAREGARLAAEQKAEAAKVVNQPTTELVDQDAVARQQALDAHRADEEKRLQDAVATVKGYTFTKITAASTASSITKSSVLGDVTIDATSTLLHDGNKYSGDSADQMAKDIGDAISQAANLVQKYPDDKELDAELGEVRVIVHIVIKFNGEFQEVATAKRGGKWPS